MLQVRQLSLVTPHPSTSLHFIVFLGFILSFFFVNEVIPMQLPKASDLLLGDYVCEKSDAVKRLSMTIIYLITSC